MIQDSVYENIMDRVKRAGIHCGNTATCPRTDNSQVKRGELHVHTKYSYEGEGTMKKHYRVTSLYGLLASSVNKEKERSIMEYGYFDDNMNFHYAYRSELVTLYPWEWRLYPDIVKMAEQKGIEIPSDTIDLSRIF